MDRLAKGSFEVAIGPQAPPPIAPGVAMGRMALEKQFQGDLIGIGKGEMLSAVSEVKGSAGYVALEKVSGTLHGRKGSFVLQHSGTMNRGAQQLSISVVPDSGTEQLVGIRGVFRIEIVEGKHYYEFEYSLPSRPA